MNAWTDEAENENEYDDFEEEDKDDIVMEEKEKDTKTESEAIKAEAEVVDETDTLPDYVTEFEARKSKELAAQAEEKKKHLRHLIGVT